MLVVEEPQGFGSYKSLGSAQGGDMHKLTMMTGVICGYMLCAGIDICLVPPAKWKGQLPKAVTKRRVEELYGRRFDTSHEADAVGIGVWFFNNYVGEVL